MEVASNSVKATPVRAPKGLHSKIKPVPKFSENSNPNTLNSSPASKPSSPSSAKSAKSKKSAIAKSSSNPVASSPRRKIRDRKFVVAKKNSEKETFGGKANKCVSSAYETLRASQEEFSKSNDLILIEEKTTSPDRDASDDVENAVEEKAVIGTLGNNGSAAVKRRRDRLLEDARKSVPEFGKVMHLVKAFERILSIPNSKESEKIDEKETEESKIVRKPVKWALPGLQPTKATETETDTTVSSSSSSSPSDLILTAKSLGLDPCVSVSSASNGSRESISRRSSDCGRRSRRNSSDSFGTTGGRKWKKKPHKVTGQKPFNLKTEQRGKVKEDGFMKKIQEMMVEAEKQRIPIAQGLPWTTDEPEILIRPNVKENTRPMDLKLHTDVRAVERARFDHQIDEKMNFIEIYKMERERQQKISEEEEINRLRKELVPKAQPMPHFDRPFVPKRSTKIPTVPKDPNFHNPEHKKIKCNHSWNVSEASQACDPSAS